MGDTAEQMAKSFKISREEQDQFAHRSHTLAEEAWGKGYLDDEVMTAHVTSQILFNAGQYNTHWF